MFDLKDEDTYFCTADIGWVTGHSYIVYGPLLNGATSLMYEGAPNYPTPDRFWSIIEKYSVSIFYTAPTAIRAFIKWGDEWPAKHDLSSLRLLGTVGEPINPEAWMWYRKHIGARSLSDRRYVVADRNRHHDDRSGSRRCCRRSPGPQHDRCRESLPISSIDAGKSVGVNEGGFLVLKTAVAVDDAHNLRRSRALQEAVLERYRRRVLHRRRRPPR